MYLGSDNYLGPTAYLGPGPNGGAPEPTADETLIQWRDITLHGLMGRFTIAELAGWDDLPDSRQQWDPRPNQHGVFDAPVYASERHVMVAGACFSGEQRDLLLRELKRAMTYGPHTEQLTITHAGLKLSVAARLVRFNPTYINWGAGAWGWQAEWVAPDPFRYGQQRSAYTGLPVKRGGLRYDLYTDGEGNETGYLDYGESSDSGRVTLRNDGDADAWPTFQVRGPAPQGVTIANVETGRRIVSTAVIPAGSTLTIRTAKGTAYLDGADRSGQLTVREWTPVPPEGERTFQFSAPTYTAAALVGSIRDTHW